MNLQLSGRTVLIATDTAALGDLDGTLGAEGANVHRVGPGKGLTTSALSDVDVIHGLVMAPPDGASVGQEQGGFDLDGWRAAVHGTIAAVTQPLREAIPLLERAGDAVVVVVLCADDDPSPTGRGLGRRAADEGIRNLVRSLSRDFGPNGITIRVVRVGAGTDPVRAVACLLSPRLGFMTGAALHLEPAATAREAS